MKLEGKMRENGGSFPLSWGILFVCIALLLFVVVLGTAFFFSVRSPEVVLVPNVSQLNLQDALLELQKKELNSRIQLRFSDRADQRGLVIEQHPKEGSQVPINSKVLLTLSKGMIAERTPNYVGESIEAVRAELEQLRQRAGGVTFEIERQIFIDSDEPVGVVVQQSPRAGTAMSSHVGLQLWLSRGKGEFSYRVPNYLGRSALEVAAELGQQNQPFEMTFDLTAASVDPVVVVSQHPEVESVVTGTTVFGLRITPAPASTGDQIFGLFRYELSSYPSVVEIKLEARLSNQLAETVFQTRHLGGLITVPYLLPMGSELSLLVNGLLIHQLKVG